MQQLGAFRIDEVHRPFDNAILDGKGFIALRNDIDDGIADTES